MARYARRAGGHSGSGRGGGLWWDGGSRAGRTFAVTGTAASETIINIISKKLVDCKNYKKAEFKTLFSF